MDKVKQKIIEYTGTLFFREGFFDSTMDRLAADLRMSKKTLYVHFPSKEALVQETANFFTEKNGAAMDAICALEVNAVEKLVRVSRFIQSVSQSLNTQVLRELQLHYPEVWLSIDEFRKQKIRKVFGSIFLQGTQSGHFIPYPSEIIIEIFLISIRGIINPAFVLENSMKMNEAFSYTVDFLMNGLLTPAGRRVYKKLNLGDMA